MQVVKTVQEKQEDKMGCEQCLNAPQPRSPSLQTTVLLLLVVSDIRVENGEHPTLTSRAALHSVLPPPFALQACLQICQQSLVSGRQSKFTIVDRLANHLFPYLDVQFLICVPKKV